MSENAALSTKRQRYGSIMSNKWVALLLCIFTVCAHRFYEGSVKMGFLYLFTLGLFGVGWLYDIIRLLMVPSSDYTTAEVS